MSKSATIVLKKRIEDIKASESNNSSEFVFRYRDRK